MKKNDKWLNYVLSLGFVLLILVCFLSMIQISRYVLEDTNSIGEHVSSAKNLLADIEEVEKSVENNDQFKTYENFNINQFRCNYYNEKISDVSYLNIRNNRSIISMEFDAPINVINNSYYVKIKNMEELSVGDNIIILKNGEIYHGQIFDINENGYKIINFDNKEKMEIEYENILGKIIVVSNND